MRKITLLVFVLVLAIQLSVFAGDTRKWRRSKKISEVIAAEKIAQSIELGAMYVGGGIALAGLFIGIGITITGKRSQN